VSLENSFGDSNFGLLSFVEEVKISNVGTNVVLMIPVLTRRLESKAEPYLGRDQYGFRRVCGTRDAIAAMRVL